MRTGAACVICCSISSLPAPQQTHALMSLRPAGGSIIRTSGQCHIKSRARAVAPSRPGASASEMIMICLGRQSSTRWRISFAAPQQLGRPMASVIPIVNRAAKSVGPSQIISLGPGVKLRATKMPSWPPVMEYLWPETVRIRAPSMTPRPSVMGKVYPHTATEYPACKEFRDARLTRRPAARYAMAPGVALRHAASTAAAISSL